jgi:hypothetical protein
MKAIETGLPETLLFSINPAFDMLPIEHKPFDYVDHRFGAEFFRGLDPKRAELYKVCTKRQIGITAMKAFGGGKLLSAEHTPYSAPLAVTQCIHYALSRPAVASVLPGCQTAAEMHEALAYLSASDAEKDYAAILSGVRNDFAGSCVYCGHCQPCPAEIDIAAVTKYIDIARLDAASIPPSIRSHYSGLTRKGGDCIRCGACEARCPFGVPVQENMKWAADRFGQ